MAATPSGDATPQPIDPNRLWKIPDFCDWAGISQRTWRSWCAEGTAPRRIKIAGSVRIKVSDALAWAEDRYVD